MTDREPDGDVLRAGERVTNDDTEGEGDWDDDIVSDVCADCVREARDEKDTDGLIVGAPVPAANADGGPEFVGVRDGGGDFDADGDAASERESPPVDDDDGDARDDGEPPPWRDDTDGFPDTDAREVSDVLEREDAEKLDDDDTEREVKDVADADLHGALLREAAEETLVSALALSVLDARGEGEPVTEIMGIALRERVTVGDGDADVEMEFEMHADAVEEVDSVLDLRAVAVVEVVEDDCAEGEGELEAECVRCAVADCDIEGVSESLAVGVSESLGERELVDDVDAVPELVGVDVADDVMRAERETEGVDERETVANGVDVAVREDVVVRDNRAVADDEEEVDRVFEADTVDVDVLVSGVDADARAEDVDVREANEDVVGGADRVAVSVAVVVFVPVVDAVEVRDALVLKVDSAPASYAPRAPCKQEQTVNINLNLLSIRPSSPACKFPALLRAPAYGTGFYG